FGIQHPITGEMLYPLRGRCWNLSQAALLEVMQSWGNYEYGEFDEEERKAREEVCGPGVKIREDIKPLIIRDWGTEDVTKAQTVYKQGNWPLFFFTGKNGEGYLGKKTYIPQEGIPPRTFWSNSVYGSNRNA